MQKQESLFSKKIIHNVQITDPKTIDWDNIGFNPIHTAYVGGMVSLHGEPYEPFTMVPAGTINLPLSAVALNYGQSIFEGLKARKGRDGKIRLFRVKDNARRLADGAKRMLMTPIPQDLFKKAVIDIVNANLEYVPATDKGSLYIRPLLIGSGEGLGVCPSYENTFCIYVCPVGNYFKGLSCINILVTKDYHRAPRKGVGHIKAAGNYAAGLYPGKIAKNKGYAEILYLDHECIHVEEVGAANFLLVKGNKLIIAESESVLPGITRDSVAKIAREKLHMEVTFEKIPIDKVLGLHAYKDEGRADEVFCTGTAAVISPIGTLHYHDHDYVIGNNEVGPVTKKLYDLLNGIQIGEYADDYGWTTIC